MVDTDKYKTKVSPKEMQLLNKNMKDILKQVSAKAVNIVDLGCGNGKKGAMFIEAFQKDNKKVRYCPIDISGHMVQQAIDNVSKTTNSEILQVQWNISDFENLGNITSVLNKGTFKKNFFLLLGNTLGNFEIHELLHQVRSSMKEGDVLLIGNGLNNHKVEQDIVKSCRENPAFDDFFSLILTQLGFNKKDLKYDARFSHSRIEFFYTVEKDVKVSFADKHIYFMPGDQIVVAVAYHYEKDDFIGYLNMYFDEVQMYKSEDGSYCLASCKK